MADRRMGRDPVTGECDANSVGLTLLRGYGVPEDIVAMIPADQVFEVYSYVENKMNRDGATRLVAEYGRGDGLRRYAKQQVLNWVFTNVTLAHESPQFLIRQCRHCGAEQNLTPAQLRTPARREPRHVLVGAPCPCEYEMEEAA